ncbi:MAG TPA: PaaI family thioesterase [Syntrophorhabdaceae bacterium]|nr:PaaI family thioesterase [Syntrophorhabdaceae bacterium]
MDNEKRSLYFKKMEEEPFARLLGIKLVEVSEGYALCEMKYTDEKDNLYGIAHGGAIFSLIDEAFEISSNSHDRIAVALNMNITYMKPPKKGSMLRAESKEINRTRRTASYNITVKDEDGLIATCQALVYIKDQQIPFLQDIKFNP